VTMEFNRLFGDVSPIVLPSIQAGHAHHVVLLGDQFVHLYVEMEFVWEMKYVMMEYNLTIWAVCQIAQDISLDGHVCEELLQLPQCVLQYAEMVLQ